MVFPALHKLLDTRDGCSGNIEVSEGICGEAKYRGRTVTARRQSRCDLDLMIKYVVVPHDARAPLPRAMEDPSSWGFSAAGYSEIGRHLRGPSSNQVVTNRQLRASRNRAPTWRPTMKLRCAGLRKV